MITNVIATTVHGRVLYEGREGDRLLVGFHGYAQLADALLADLQEIPGMDAWSVAAVQALHPFYMRSGEVVASWMTSLDREHAIADNLGWVRTALASLPPARTLVFAGFSQGAAMAARAAAFIRPCHGAILLGGDVPPEIRNDPGIALPPMLLGRGNRDDWYTDEKLKNDLKFLESRTRVTPCVFEGGHEWTGAFRQAAGEFLASLVAG